MDGILVRPTPLQLRFPETVVEVIAFDGSYGYARYPTQDIDDGQAVAHFADPILSSEYSAVIVAYSATIFNREWPLPSSAFGRAVAQLCLMTVDWDPVEVDTQAEIPPFAGLTSELVLDGEAVPITLNCDKAATLAAVFLLTADPVTTYYGLGTAIGHDEQANTTYVATMGGAAWKVKR